MSEETPKDDLLEKLKKMSLADLKQYDAVTTFLNNTLNTGGVLMILGMLYMPTVGVLAVGGIVLYLLASTSVNTTKFRVEIRKLIETKDK